MDLELISIKKPDALNVIIGQAHFIKTVEDLFETLIESAAGIRFGLAFCEASGSCLVRSEGNSPELKKIAEDNALAIGAGHSFIVVLKDAYPVNVLNRIKGLSEVCSIFAATANPVSVVVADSGTGRGILGVIDGARPKGIESERDIAWRTDLLRTIGYKK
jgi:uncharacterized protein